MDKINNFEQVTHYLKQDEIVCVLKPDKIYFALKGSRIHVKNDQAQYYLSWESFSELFSQAVFFLYERKEEALIEPSKDEEYYGWKHK
jgi:hypothetical protein